MYVLLKFLEQSCVLCCGSCQEVASKPRNVRVSKDSKSSLAESSSTCASSSSNAQSHGAPSTSRGKFALGKETLMYVYLHGAKVRLPSRVGAA